MTTEYTITAHHISKGKPLVISRVTDMAHHNKTWLSINTADGSIYLLSNDYTMIEGHPDAK